MKSWMALALLLALHSAAAAQPSPLAEIGDDDFRISFQGAIDDPAYAARGAAVAYNSTDDEFLVVWVGDFVRGVCFPLTVVETEVIAQRLDAADGQRLGAPIVVSSSGPQCDDTHIVERTPAVVYNATQNEYLVVWSGEDDRDGMVDGEYEIFGQRLSAAGVGVGVDDIRISDLGGSGDADGSAYFVDAVWDAADDEYLVVFSGVDALADGSEIFGQRLNENGTEVGTNDFQISQLGGEDAAAVDPSVAWNAADEEYLVVWTTAYGEVPTELEVFGQRLDDLAAEIGAGDFRISDLGGDGANGYAAREARAAWSPNSGEYLVVWMGDDDVGGLSADELEIFGQRLDALGGQVGANDFRISDMGDTGDNPFDAKSPEVLWNPVDAEFLVTWYGDDDVGGQVDEENEIFVQRIDAAGGAVGANDRRISDMGTLGTAAYDALWPALAHRPSTNHYLVVWEGYDDSLAAGEEEIFGQRLAGPTLFRDGFESGDSARWSASLP